MHFIWIFLIIIFSLHNTTSISVSKKQIPTVRVYPQTDFRSPLDIKPALAGSFGEIRANHFHSGLDFKTNQREGYPVYAVADGYISRVRIQMNGYGNALYITHPNGYTSVYGHLKRYNANILKKITDYQYSKESFEIDLPLLPSDLPVKKGEIIAWSGNSGGSAGPHLHFEIRDTQTEETINPQLFGFQVADFLKPIINGLYIYDLNGQPFNENTNKHFFKVSGTAGKYHLKLNQTLTTNGQIGLGIRTYDKNSASNNFNGVYSIELLLDEKPIYSSIWERFFFNHSRAVNSHIDYPEFLKSGIIIQKSFVEPGNPLTLFQNLENQGLINLSDSNIHNIQYVVKDIKGNTSTLEFNIKSNAEAINPIQSQKVNTFYYNRINNYSNGVVKVSMPVGVLYSDLDFAYFSTPKPISGAFSSIHHIHTKLIPLQNNYSLWIKPDSSLPISLQTKALIVDINGVAQGGEFEDGYVKASLRNFGSFYVKLDTTDPEVTPLNISEGKNMANTPKVKIKISDNLSGINTYRGTIDDKWVLMEYDQKTRTLWHSFDERTLPGKHIFKLVVSDQKSNSTTFTANFYR